MSILIKGMEMPTSCYLCPFCDYVSARCDAVKGNPYTPTNRYEVRADWCPLVPVPPHGRCIDADALVMENYTQYGAIDALALEAIKAAPTILEAEEGE
mgnify:CR=1 FL=1